MIEGQTNSSRRVLAASLVGTAIEFYDFYVYATAASLVFGRLFFPQSSASAQLLSAYASFGLAFIARPLGSVVFGYAGDRIGRKSTLVASLLTMGASTVLIGLLPTYASIVWGAPLLLCILRFGQGFGLGGEWGGAVLLAVENAPPGYTSRYGMFPQLGAPVGFIAANGMFLLLGTALTPVQFESWGWRVPFLASILLVAIGLWVRLKLTETPAFKAALAQGMPEDVPLAELVRQCPRETIGGTFAVVVCFALFYLATAFSLSYGTGALHYDRSLFLGVLLVAILFLALGIVLAAAWSDATSPRRVLLVGCVATLVLSFFLAPMLQSGSLLIVWLFLSLALFIMGFVYGPLGGWLPNFFPTRMCYTGASVAFNVGGILGGGLAPLLAQFLSDRGGLGLVGVFLGACALISFLAIFLTRSVEEARVA